MFMQCHLLCRRVKEFRQNLTSKQSSVTVGKHGSRSVQSAALEDIPVGFGAV